MTEAQIEESILQLLASMGWFAWKNPSTGYHDGKGWRKQASKWAINGVSDVIAIKNGIVLFIEVKTPQNRQSEAQKLFQQNILQQNGHYLVARSPKDILEYIRSNLGQNK